MIKGINHVGVVVKSIDDVLGFFRTHSARKRSSAWSFPNSSRYHRSSGSGKAVLNSWSDRAGRDGRQIPGG